MPEKENKNHFDISNFFPIINCLKTYRKEYLIKDIIASITTAILIIPNSIAVAIILGVSPAMGLYSGIFGAFIYALFGTSRQLSVGPSSVVAILIVSLLKPLHADNPDSYITSVILLSLVIGVIFLVMGIFKLGFMDNFLSHTVISGFVAAAAIIIIGSQLENFIGTTLHKQEIVLLVFYDAIVHSKEIHFPTLLIGLLSVIIIYVFKRFTRLIPGSLISVIVSILIVYYFGLHTKGVKIIGDIQFGIPKFQLPALPGKIDIWQSLFGIALTIGIIGFVESISLAKDMAVKTRQDIDANQELKALGITNICGAFFNCFPVVGGFAPTAVNFAAGAQSGLASLFTAIIVFIASIFLTPYLSYTPKSCLAGMIIVAMLGLINIRSYKHIFKVRKSDGFTFLITFLLTLFIGVEKGILIGVILSLAMYIWRTATPQVVVLGRLLDTEEEIYRDVERYNVETLPYITILRVDSSLYFVNVKYVGDKIIKLFSKYDDIKYVILHAEAINHIDYPAEEELRRIADSIKHHGSELYIVSLKDGVADVLKKSEFYEFLGEDHFFETIGQAIKHIKSLYNTRRLDMPELVDGKTSLLRLTEFFLSKK